MAARGWHVPGSTVHGDDWRKTDDSEGDAAAAVTGEKDRVRSITSKVSSVMESRLLPGHVYAVTLLTLSCSPRIIDLRRPA